MDTQLTQAGSLLNTITSATKGISHVPESTPELHKTYTTLLGKLNAANMLFNQFSPQLKDKTYSKYLGNLL